MYGPACRTPTRRTKTCRWGPRLIVALHRPAELLGKQVAALQLEEGTRLLPLSITQDPGHGKPGVVIENPRRHAAKILEGADVGFEESLCRLSRNSPHKTVTLQRAQ